MAMKILNKQNTPEVKYIKNTLVTNFSQQKMWLYCWTSFFTTTSISIHFTFLILRKVEPAYACWFCENSEQAKYIPLMASLFLSRNYSVHGPKQAQWLWASLIYLTSLWAHVDVSKIVFQCKVSHLAHSMIYLLSVLNLLLYNNQKKRKRVEFGDRIDCF